MHKIDLIALDREDRPFLLVEAQRRPVPAPEALTILQELSEAREALPYGRAIRFGMIADPDSIHLYDLDRDPHRPLASWDTGEILGHYAPDIPSSLHGPRGVPADSIAGLIGSWLRDIGHRWKSPTPPGLGDWQTLGLLSRLTDGSTLSEVPLGFDALR